MNGRTQAIFLTVCKNRTFIVTQIIASGVVAMLMVAIPFFLTFHNAFMQAALTTKGSLLLSLPSYVLVQYPPGMPLLFFCITVFGIGHLSALQAYLYRYAREQKTKSAKNLHHGAWIAAILSAGCSACGVVAVGALLNIFGVGSLAALSAVSDAARVLVFGTIIVGSTLSWRMIARVS